MRRALAIAALLLAPAASIAMEPRGAASKLDRGDAPETQTGDAPETQTGDAPETQTGDAPEPQTGDAPETQTAHVNETPSPPSPDPEADAELTRERGWPGGSIRAQLDKDPTLIPFGKGAIFVPAMTNPYDEPTVTVYQAKHRLAVGTTGQRIILEPGAYEVHVGSGTEPQRLHLQAAVREQNITVLPASWAGLVVHVVDEQYASTRASYELIRVDDREYIGIGFGTDEQGGEPVSTWILRPGLYKIVRVGENYRARRDFATVRIVEGKLTHFLLVVNAANGGFQGGGEIPEAELFRPHDGFFGSVILGGDASMNSRRGVLGLADGLSFTLRAFADARMSLEIGKRPLVLQFQLEEGQTKNPELPWQKSNDRARLDMLYVYRLTPWIGPYARVGAVTNVLPGKEVLDGMRDVLLLRRDGSVAARRDLALRVPLSPSFGLITLKEGTGLNLRLFKEIYAESTVRTGLGARHRLTRSLFERADAPATPELEYREVPAQNRFGVEGTLLASARITRWILANLEFDSLLPFTGIQDLVLEVEGSIAVKLTTFASINYRLRLLRDPSLSAKDVLEQDVLLRLSLEIL